MRTNHCLIIIIWALLCLFPFGGRAQNAAGWQCDIYQYQYDMTVYGRLVQNGEIITDDKFTIKIIPQAITIYNNKELINTKKYRCHNAHNQAIIPKYTQRKFRNKFQEIFDT